MILGPTEREAAAVGFVALAAAGLQALALVLAVAAERRNPGAEHRPILRRRRAMRGEAAGESGVKLPQRLVVVPAVVEHEGVELHAAPGRQLRAERTDHLQTLRLVHFQSRRSDVEPGDVVDERPVGPSPLPFQVILECTAELTLRGHANHGRRCGQAGHGRLEDRQRAHGRRPFHLVLGQWMLTGQEPVAHDQR